jgi:hypothetical protein
MANLIDKLALQRHIVRSLVIRTPHHFVIVLWFLSDRKSSDQRQAPRRPGKTPRNLVFWKFKAFDSDPCDWIEKWVLMNRPAKYSLADAEAAGKRTWGVDFYEAHRA